MAIRLIAHRGASDRCPENTLAAFKAAARLGARSAEFDVQQTKDGVLVVAHDVTMRRTAGARRALGGLSWAELSRLDVGAWFKPAFKGARVPRLEEALDALEGLEIQLEVKQPKRPYPGIEERVLAALRGRPGLAARTVISSFDYPTLQRMRRLSKTCRLGWLADKKGFPDAEAARAAALRAESIHLSRRWINGAWVAAARRRGLKILVYTVDTREELARLERLGVDAVFTNVCDLLGAAVAA